MNLRMRPRPKSQALIFLHRGEQDKARVIVARSLGGREVRDLVEYALSSLGRVLTKNLNSSAEAEREPVSFKSSVVRCTLECSAWLRFVVPSPHLFRFPGAF